MQGLGNDFVILDGVRHSIQITPDLIRQMADRHFGIGFDQLLLIEPTPALKPHADFSYRIFNADGTEVSQCGNGARCVGQFLYETRLVDPNATRIVLATKERYLEIEQGESGHITVNMGIPVFEPEQVPYIEPKYPTAPSAIQEFLTQTSKLSTPFGVVNVGNPHVVLRVENINTINVEAWGRKIGADPAFPEGVNVGFMQVLHSQQIALRVYERGAGETWACGSGACAATVIGGVRGWLDAQVNVKLRGGDLDIHWLGDHHSIRMTGPAKTVFKGKWLLEERALFNS